MALNLNLPDASSHTQAYSSAVQSWYEHEDDRCISGVVQDEVLGYDMHTITGARPTIYKEILKGLEEMKLACMWNESEWRDYAYDRRSYSCASCSNSYASSEIGSIYESDLGASDASSIYDSSEEESPKAPKPSTTVNNIPGEKLPVGNTSSDAFIDLYKGYQKYAYY